MQLLLDAKADPNLRSDVGDVPIFWSLYSNDLNVRTNVLELLLDHGAEVDIRDQSGATSLIRVSADGGLAKLELLLAHKADPNARDNRGDSALHYLAWRATATATSPEILDMARRLIDAGAHVNALNNAGATPLAELMQPQATRFAPPSMLPPGLAEAAKKPLAALLREHGGVQDMPLPDRIQVRGPGASYSRYVFAKGTNDWNRFSLLELIAVNYDLLAADPNGQSSEDNSIQRWASGLQTLGFPDLSRITVRGLGPSGGERNVDLGLLVNKGDCSKDVPLAWGDVVQIPQADHLLREVWEGFTAEQFMNLKKCLTRAVDIIVKGKASRITLAPDITFTKEYVSRQESDGKITTGQKEKVGGLRTGTSFWIRSVLLGSHLVLTSSDLSRVKVTRTDPTTGQKREWIVDCSEGNPDFWVNDGDLIEVPEK